MKVSNIRKRKNGKWVELSAVVSSKAADVKDFKIIYRVAQKFENYLGSPGNVFLSALLVPSLFFAEDLIIEAPVSKALMHNANRIKKIMSSWKETEEWKRVSGKVTIRSQGFLKRQDEGTGVAAFFSGGVDSFFTLVTNGQTSGNTERISHVINIQRISPNKAITHRLHDIELLTEKVAKEFSVEPIIVYTNIRDLLDPVIFWTMAHGGVLGSSALLLGGLIKKSIINSSDAYRWGVPYGTHPAVDPLWSTETTHSLQFGDQFTRKQKIQAIAHNPLVQKHLQVCWQAKNHYNCSRCSKCLLAMLQLETVGVRSEFTCFDQDISCDVLESVVEPPQRIFNWREVVQTLPDTPENKIIKEKITSMIERSEQHTTANRRHGSRSALFKYFLSRLSHRSPHERKNT